MTIWCGKVVTADFENKIFKKNRINSDYFDNVNLHDFTHTYTIIKPFKRIISGSISVGTIGSIYVYECASCSNCRTKHNNKYYHNIIYVISRYMDCFRLFYDTNVWNCSGYARTIGSGGAPPNR